MKRLSHHDKNGKPLVALHWDKYFQRICKKYNSIYKEELPADYSSRLQAYLLHEDGKERSQPQNTAILNGSF